MKVEHKLYGSQVEYGYIWWNRKKNNSLSKVFPEDKFTVEINNEKVKDRKVDWRFPRVFIGQSLRDNFNQGDVVIIERKTPSSNLVKIYKR